MLTEKEKKIIGQYSEKIRMFFPGEITEVLIYGSKARGDDNPDSDIDLLVVTEFDDWRKADQIRIFGYEMDWSIGARLSIQVISKEHYAMLKKNGFEFALNIEKDAVPV
jgi:predicted nucleotidyltransferase